MSFQVGYLYFTARYRKNKKGNISVSKDDKFTK
jgi:hypothetical protein